MTLLKVDKLRKRFDQTTAVDGVSFAVEEGQIYGLLGPNGAGKTTTISIICGLLKPDGGEVSIAGRSFWSDPVAARRIMGVVPQDLALYEELSGRENLEFWGRIAGLTAKAARARAGELLEALSLVERGDDALKHYSGGMKRRINLGCALLHRPRLLLLDEPTVGIDPQARMNILEFIRTLVADGVSILYTTHYLEEAERLCDRVGIIDQGRVLAEGSLTELQRRFGDAQLFIIEGALDGANPETWPDFREHFRVIQQSARQLVVTSSEGTDPAVSMKRLLAIPVPVENVTLKRPSLNDVFLQLTGRELRE